MIMSKCVELLKKLCFVKGTSGNEKVAAQVALALLREYMPCHIDSLGNVIGSTGENNAILLDAHLDQIGLIVTGICDKGFLKVAKVGGADARVLTGTKVTVHGKKELFGVVTSVPPHLAKENDRDKATPIDEIAIDVGLSKQEAEKFISPGDRITFNGRFESLLNGRVSSPCLDDRAGIVAVLLALDMLKDEKNLCDINVQFTVQEETGGSGAKVASFKSQPAEAIGVEVSFASAPGVSSEKYFKLGGGTLVGYAPGLDYEMSRKLTELANEKNIPNQSEVMGGRTGTNCDSIQNSGRGVKTALLSVPIRNMHTTVELCQISDIEATARLIYEYILERSKNNA